MLKIQKIFLNINKGVYLIFWCVKISIKNFYGKSYFKINNTNFSGS